MQIHKEDFLWDWLKHESTIFSNRMNAFLIAESMLLIAYISNNNIIFPFIGVMITLIWLSVNYRHVSGTMRSLIERVNIHFAAYRVVQSEMDNVGVPNTVLLGYVLPSIILVMWVVLYIF
jgi:hypothetical protein